MSEPSNEIRFVNEHIPFLTAEYDLHWQPLPDKFHFRKLIGRGGMGEVWMAWQPSLRRDVAIKTIRRDRFRPDALAMLQEEAKKLADLSGDRRIGAYITQTFDLCDDGERYFLVTEFVEGGSFRDRVRRFGALHWLTASRYLIDCAEVLAVIHEKGIVHRDIKPDNLLWSLQDDRGMLTDFGIAAHASDPQNVGCTPGFVGLEILQHPLGPATDVFALGVTGWYLTTGVNPFAGTKLMESLEKVRAGISPAQRAAHPASEAFIDVLIGAMEAKPRQRPDMRQFAEQLRRAIAVAVSEIEPSENSIRRIDLTAEVFCGERLPTSKNDSAGSTQQSASEPIVCEAQNGEPVRIRFTSDSGGYLSLILMGSSGEVTTAKLDDDQPVCFIQPGGGRDLTFTIRPPAGTDGIIGLLSDKRDGVNTDSIIHSLTHRELGLISVQPLPHEQYVTAAVQIIHR